MNLQPDRAQPCQAKDLIVTEDNMQNFSHTQKWV